MTIRERPQVRPNNPCFSSGPCAKRPGWKLNNLDKALIGRSHRSKLGKARLAESIEKTRTILNIPDDYKIGVVPASDTGAVEMALWSLLGARGVDLLAWESFGYSWVNDVIKQLKLKDARVLKADYSKLPNLTEVNFKHDVVFTWNGTTSGVRIPNGDWIAIDREGLTICDATSAAFAQKLPWIKLDVTTFSWQKALGGEAAHGIIVLSPRAVERLETYVPDWPMPKIFLMTKDGKLIDSIFKGETINTPSMLCVEDYIDALNWSESIGGLKFLIARADRNTAIISEWVERTPWVDFLAEDINTRSNTSVCLKIIDSEILMLSDKDRTAFAKKIADILDAEDVAYDIAGHRDAPANLRIWAGATIENDDISALMPWLDWAFVEAKASLKAIV